MLVSLHVRNLALIEETEVFFQPGLNILTGETGAGKSVILGSVALALGAKADRDMIRTGDEVVLADDLVRIVNIEFKTGHNSEVIPQLMLEIGYITQVGKHIPHYIDNGVGTTLTFCTILNGQRIIYHVLDATPVFGKRHSFLLSIVLHLLN